MVHHVPDEKSKTVIFWLFSSIVCSYFLLHRKQQGKGTIGKKKSASNGEKSSKADSTKEGKAKAKAPRGMSRALTKLAKQ